MSGSGEDGKRRRPSGLTTEDHELWSFVARSIGPARGKSRVRDIEPQRGLPPARLETPVDNVPTSPPPPAPRPAKQRTQVVPPPRVPARTPPPPEPVALERRKARRIARGAEEIEARLDLHGMTQEDAHAALVGFVRRCSSEGRRTVLVITGKGGAGRGGDRHDDEVVPRPRGVLRRNVPRWLASPEIAALVVSYTVAHIRHGGEGALYVRLRRRS